MHSNIKIVLHNHTSITSMCVQMFPNKSLTAGHHLLNKLSLLLLCWHCESIVYLHHLSLYTTVDTLNSFGSWTIDRHFSLSFAFIIASSNVWECFSFKSISYSSGLVVAVDGVVVVVAEDGMMVLEVSWNEWKARPWFRVQLSWEIAVTLSYPIFFYEKYI